MWLRCDVCRRYAPLKLGGLHDVDYRTKTFSCSRCGGEAYFCLVEPVTAYVVNDYRPAASEEPGRLPGPVKGPSGRLALPVSTPRAARPRPPIYLRPSASPPR